MNPLMTSPDRYGFIQQHLNTHLFKRRDHPNGVVIAQDTVNRTFQVRANHGKAFDGFAKGTVCFCAIVTGQDTKVILETRENVDQSLHRLLIHVDVQIADMEDGEAVE